MKSLYLYLSVLLRKKQKLIGNSFRSNLSLTPEQLLRNIEYNVWRKKDEIRDLPVSIYYHTQKHKVIIPV